MYNNNSLDEFIKEAAYSQKIEEFFTTSIQKTLISILNQSSSVEDVMSMINSTELFDEYSAIAFKDMYIKDSIDAGVEKIRAEKDFNSRNPDYFVNLIMKSESLPKMIGSLLREPNLQKYTEAIKNKFAQDIKNAMSNLV